jgi:hypothetical protein
MVLLFEQSFNTIVCDQLALYVPFMRLKAKVMFYCHYPDKLLAPPGGFLRRLYRQCPLPVCGTLLAPSTLQYKALDGLLALMNQQDPI